MKLIKNNKTNYEGSWANPTVAGVILGQDLVY